MNKSLQNNNVKSDEMQERLIYKMEHNPFIFESLYFIVVQTKIQLYTLIEMIKLFKIRKIPSL